MTQKDRSKKSLSERLRHIYYQAAVQDPQAQIENLQKFYRNQADKDPHILREDFCGTFLLATQWIKENSVNNAWCVDLDEETLKYGESFHLSKLQTAQQRRIKIFHSDVRSVRTPKSDIIAACNFSFFCLKKRADLLKYFRNTKNSLKKNGILALEMAGGPGFERAPEREYRYVTKRRDGKGGRWFRYCWDQQTFNHVTREGLYAIHFKPEGKSWFKDVFLYDWRIWTIPELRELLAQAGFKETKVYLEDDESGDFRQVDMIDDEYETWVCYLVASG